MAVHLMLGGSGKRIKKKFHFCFDGVINTSESRLSSTPIYGRLKDVTSLVM